MRITTVAVIGAGTMGAGIAQVCAQAGWKTNLYDAFPEGLERGMERITSFWEKGIARGKTTERQKKAFARYRERHWGDSGDCLTNLQILMTCFSPHPRSH